MPSPSGLRRSGFACGSPSREGTRSGQRATGTLSAAPTSGVPHSKDFPFPGSLFFCLAPAVYADQASPAARLLGKGLGADNVPLARCLPLRLRAYHSSQATIACGNFCCFCDACGPNTRAENQGERQWRELISRPVVSPARRPAAASHLPPTHPLWSEIHPQTCR